MTINKEEIKNKIIYRASYRGTKEMDILMTAFVRSIINNIDENYLETLNDFVNMDDETLKSIKKKESLINVDNSVMLEIIDKFQKY
tara:strand:+ start:1723 stop:1980 length:258 start_codon:yes stop_codon:yes gene_type:complete